jgi:hypothetical protein
MIRVRPMTVALAAAVLGAVACQDGATAPEFNSIESAFNSTPVGFSMVASSYDASSGGDGMPWQPEVGRRDGRGMPNGFPRGPGMMNFMGGGMMDANFLGAVAFGRGPDRGPFNQGGDDLTNCTFSAATGDVTCPAKVLGGLTLTKVLTIKSATGVAQSKIDSTSNSIRTRLTANGSVQRRDSVTATVQNSSDRTVTGLAAGATVRTVNGTASGLERSTGKTKDGVAFTAERTTSDVTTGLTIPLENGKPTYPTAGTVKRSMKAVMTSDGKTTTSTRDEVLTYDGSATAKLVITQDGTTKSCTLPLPMGRPVCQ